MTKFLWLGLRSTCVCSSLAKVYDFEGRPYKSLYQGLRAINKVEGFRGLYKGLSPALVANGVSWGGYFLLYEHAKNR